MNKKLISIAVTTALVAGTAQHAHANDQNTDDRHKQYIGTGIGATAGAIFAGPVGLIVGGLIGNLAGRHEVKDDNATALTDAADAPQVETVSNQVPTSPSEDAPAKTIVLARAGEIDSNIENTDTDKLSALKTSLVENLQLDIFFLSGSTRVEDYYKDRLLSVTNLMRQMPDIDIYLEGYSDRRGDRDSNMALSSQRLESVRRELVQAGIDASRIQMNALGEQQFVSRPGELEAYSFDRRVVMRFEHPAPASQNPVALSEASQPLAR